MCSIFGYCGKVRDEAAFKDGFSQTKCIKKIKTVFSLSNGSCSKMAVISSMYFSFMFVYLQKYYITGRLYFLPKYVVP